MVIDPQTLTNLSGGLEIMRCTHCMFKCRAFVGSLTRN
jgi:hypothetical protein